MAIAARKFTPKVTNGKSPLASLLTQPTAGISNPTSSPMAQTPGLLNMLSGANQGIPSGGAQVSQDRQQAPNPASATTIATAQAIDAGAKPKSLDTAINKLDDQSYIGFCERYVENVNGKSGVYPSAAVAWEKQQDTAVQGLQGVKPGDTIYFAPDDSNHGYGHAGIYTGEGKFVSATSSGVKEHPLVDWVKSTGQQILGYIPKGK